MSFSCEYVRRQSDNGGLVGNVHGYGCRNYLPRRDDGLPGLWIGGYVDVALREQSLIWIG